MPFGVAFAAVLGANTAFQDRGAQQMRPIVKADAETPLSRVVMLDLDDTAEIREPAVIGRAIDLENQ